MLNDYYILGQRYWHLYLIYGPSSIIIYALIIEFTLVKFRLFDAEPMYWWPQLFRTTRKKMWNFTELTPPLNLTPKIPWYYLSIPPFDTLWTITEEINIVYITVMIK